MNAPLPNEILRTIRPVPAAMLDALRTRFGDRCSTATAVREQHGRVVAVFELVHDHRRLAPPGVSFDQAAPPVQFTAGNFVLE